MKYIVNGTKKSSEDDNSKPWYLLGIVSFGTCGLDRPGMYTRF